MKLAVGMLVSSFRNTESLERIAYGIVALSDENNVQVFWSTVGRGRLLSKDSSQRLLDHKYWRVENI